MQIKLNDFPLVTCISHFGVTSYTYVKNSLAATLLFYIFRCVGVKLFLLSLCL